MRRPAAREWKGARLQPRPSWLTRTSRKTCETEATPGRPASPEQLDDLVLLGEAALLLLREHERAVCDHVELALPALDGRRIVADALQRGRETRGPAVVAVSDGAVEDLDAHARRLSERVSRLGGGRPFPAHPSHPHFILSPTPPFLDLPFPTRVDKCPNPGAFAWSCDHRAHHSRRGHEEGSTSSCSGPSSGLPTESSGTPQESPQTPAPGSSRDLTKSTVRFRLQLVQADSGALTFTSKRSPSSLCALQAQAAAQSATSARSRGGAYANVHTATRPVRYAPVRSR